MAATRLSSFYNSAKQLLRSLSLSVPLTIIFVDNFAYIAKVEGVSMQPTLNDDDLDDSTLGDDRRSDSSLDNVKRYLNRFNSSDLVLLSHWSTRNYQLERGEIVSLVSPKNPNQILIKRVIGLEGDTVITRGNPKFDCVRIPKGHCWVEGDNHSKSLDSNMFGPVAVGLITAQAKCVIWPPKRWRSLPATIPSDRKTSLISSIHFQGSYSQGAQVVVELKNQQHYFDWRSMYSDEEREVD